MTMTVQHPVADWYLAFDDLWELMRVNWQTHNTFTQSGMWDAGDYIVKGIVLVVDSPPYRGVLLCVDLHGEDDYVTIVTYGPKCGECGFTPYNAYWYGADDQDGALEAAITAFNASVVNAQENGIERLHEDDCSHLRYPETEDDDEEDDE